MSASASAAGGDAGQTPYLQRALTSERAGGGGGCGVRSASASPACLARATRSGNRLEAEPSSPMEDPRPWVEWRRAAVGSTPMG
eukprot:scaffold9330_cov117-Isochrysis_galbana.AAC.16